jgi:predicted nucleotidyltransferase
VRISAEQIATIIRTTRNIAGQDAQVWLFGSRLDDARKGGDIDLLIESAPVAGLMERARIKNRLEHQLQLPVDVLATRLGAKESPFVSIARAQAVRLSL